MSRYQVNPTRNWGPQARASAAASSCLDERREKGMKKAAERRKRKQDAPEVKENFEISGSAFKVAEFCLGRARLETV